MAVNPLALGGGILVAAAAIGGGVYAAGTLSPSTKETNGGEGTKIEWFSLYEDAAYKTVSGTAVTVQSPYQGNYGETYSKYFVGQESKSNKWWEQTFNNEIVTKKPDIKDKFKSLKDAGKTYSDLKTLCDEAYKDKLHNATTASTGKIKTSVAAESNTDFQESNIWLFCSPIGQKPSTLQGYTQETYGNNKRGNDTDAKPKLISVVDSKNAIFWEIRQQEFFADSGNFTGKTATTNSFFKKFYDDNIGLNTGRKLIKDRCKEAYNKENSSSSGENTPTKQETIKYCSLTGS